MARTPTSKRRAGCACYIIPHLLPADPPVSIGQPLPAIAARMDGRSSAMTKSVFDDAARRRLGEGYPLRPVPLDHRLGDHPLFTIEALKTLARRMDPVDILSNMADLRSEER